MPTIKELIDKGFDVLFVSHAKSILEGEFTDALTEVATVLDTLKLPITEIIGSGGGETKFTQRMRRELADLGWVKHNFEIAKIVDGVQKESTSHEVDHVRRVPDVGVIACEIEWNNKDPFFDRDLENFKRLHAEGAISIGIIITRGASLQNALWTAVRRFATDRSIESYADLELHGYTPTPKQKKAVMKRVERPQNPKAFADAWTDNFVSNKYGQATTHWDKLIHRVNRGVGNPCPLLLIGLPDTIIQFDEAPVEELGEDDIVDEAPGDGVT